MPFCDYINVFLFNSSSRVHIRYFSIEIISLRANNVHTIDIQTIQQLFNKIP